MSIHYHAVFAGLFGWPGTWGTGGNLVAWVICGGLGFGWLHARQQARHVEALAQSARHHKEMLAQAAAHHEAQLAALRSHCDDVKDHVTATRPASSVVVDAPVLPDPGKLRHPGADDRGRPVRADGSVIPETPQAAKRREARVRGEPK